MSCAPSADDDGKLALGLVMADALESLTERVERIDQRGEQMDRRFEQIDQRFEQIDQRFEQMEKKLDALSSSVDKRFDEVTESFVEQRKYTELAYSRLAADMRTGFDGIDRKLDQFIDAQSRIRRRPAQQGKKKH